MVADNKKLSPEERQEQIVRYLMLHDRIKVTDIAEMFSVTTETARKDLFVIEKNGQAKRFHGGAARQDYYPGTFINERMELNILNKQKVAKKAASLVPDGTKLLIDSGSTTYSLCCSLGSKSDLFIITNSLSIANLSANYSFRTMILGGEVFKSDLSAVGLWADLCLSNITVDIAFLGASGLNSLSGPSVENFWEANVKKSIIQHAKSSYIIADSSKCECTSLVQFANWADVDGLIIDANAPASFIERVQNLTKVIIAE